MLLGLADLRMISICRSWRTSALASKQEATLVKVPKAWHVGVTKTLLDLGLSMLQNGCGSKIPGT